MLDTKSVNIFVQDFKVLITALIYFIKIEKNFCRQDLMKPE